MAKGGSKWQVAILRSVWCFGKIEKKWYIAYWGVNERYAQHLRDLGYCAEISLKAPTRLARPTSNPQGEK